MVRFRPVSSIVRALVLGSAAAGAVAVSGIAAVGCADESQPKTWVKRLDDPVQRPAAIKRLVQFFEDGMTRSNKNRNDPKVKALLDEIVEPLTKTYTDAPLDDRTRIELIKFLADTRDVRAKAAWIKALSGFAAGSGPTEDDVRWAAPAVGALKLEEAADALGKAFVKLQAGTQKGSQAYKNVHDAMVAMHSPTWKAIMLERLARPIDKPSGAGQSDKVTAFQNELFWQTTAAEVLGDLRDPVAVKPLFRVVLDPNKADVASTASVALIKIGKDAEPFLFNVLAGKDEEIIDFAKGHAGGNVEESKAYVRAAAVVLGAIGRSDATDPMMHALASADSEVNRAIVARELTKLPTTPAAEKAFQAAYEKVGPSTLLPPGESNARAQLVEAAAHFYDPQLVPWLLTAIKKAKGNEDERKQVQTSALVTAVKLMNKSQAADVKAAVEKEGTSLEKDAYKLASDEVSACGENVGCYLSKLQEQASQQEKTQFIGIKAAYMLAVLGNAGTSMEIVKALPKVKNAAVRFSAASAIDHLTLKNALPVSDALQKLVDENKAKDDRSMMQADAPVKEVVYRLRAR